MITSLLALFPPPPPYTAREIPDFGFLIAGAHFLLAGAFLALGILRAQIFPRWVAWMLLGAGILPFIAAFLPVLVVSDLVLMARFVG